MCHLMDLPLCLDVPPHKASIIHNKQHLSCVEVKLVPEEFAVCCSKTRFPLRDEKETKVGGEQCERESRGVREEVQGVKLRERCAKTVEA